MTGREPTTGADATPRPLPSTYPDRDVVGWMRTDDIEFADLHIRMTITPGDNIVQLWELEDDHPVSWLGNVFRIDLDPPLLRLSCNYEQAIASYARRETLARIAVKFWMA